MREEKSPFPGPSVLAAPLGSRPTALILSGGASLSSWQGGVLYALEKKHGLSFQAVLGSSAGSINGAAYFQDNTEILRDLWRDVPRKTFLRFSPRLRPPSLLSMDPVRGYLSTIISEERCRERRRCWYYAVSADIRNGGVVQATYSPEPDGPWDSPLLDHILGSVAVPFLFPPVEVKPADGPIKDRVLVDGHVTSFAFLRPLVDRGARDFLFINVVGGVGPRRTRLGPRKYITALITEMMQCQVSNSLEALRPSSLGLGLRAFEFHPSEPLEIGVFSFRKDECRWGFDLGLKDADSAMKRVEGSRIL